MGILRDYIDKLKVCKTIAFISNYEANAQTERGETEESGLGGPHGKDRIERLGYIAFKHERLADSPLRLLLTRKSQLVIELDDSLDDLREGRAEMREVLGYAAMENLLKFLEVNKKGKTRFRSNELIVEKLHEYDRSQ